jgi:acryloyl-coenzyme A reductase
MKRAGERMRMMVSGFDVPLVREVDDSPPREPLGHEIVVEVDACGVCHRDLIDRAGRFPFQQLPITPGHEAAGTVLAVGGEVRGISPGDRVATLHRDACGECAACSIGETSLCDRAACVFGILADGGYARHIVAPASAFYPVPRDLPAVEAAVFHCTFGTAYRDLVTLGQLRKGERVLITGANGGVGSSAVQIAARLGAEVIAAVRSEAHVAPLVALGAHRVVVDAGRTIHEGLGTKVDLALDTVGAATFPSALRALRVGGRIVVVGNIVPEKVGINLGYLITLGLTIKGGSGATPREMKELFALHAEKPFAVVIDRVLPLARAEEAQRIVQAGGIRGRVVLTPSA